MRSDDEARDAKRFPISSFVLEDEQTWIDKENAACNFRDELLKKRFLLLLQQFWTSMGQTIPFACQDWASTKAAYRFFANDHVCEQDILGGHFQATYYKGFPRFQDEFVPVFGGCPASCCKAMVELRNYKRPY